MTARADAQMLTVLLWLQAYGAYSAKVEVTHCQIEGVAQNWADRYHRPTRGQFVENGNSVTLRDWKDAKKQEGDE